tara:strand:- start:7818 stop:8273 length:456 start_codon:yes stop_codon:yes gene_type:complete
MLINEWGNACWFLFHTLSYKLKDEESEHAKELLKIFIEICKILPCPICREDATKMLNNSKSGLVKTKPDLIRFMWQFHNLVNKKLNKPVFTMEEHNNKYAKTVTHNVVNFYIYVMSKNMNNSKAMIQTYQRQNKIASFKAYYAENIHRFNP